MKPTSPTTEQPRPTRPKPRTFDHFPEAAKCPVCKTNDDGECVLVGIDGTEDGHNQQAQPVHFNCAVVTNFSREAKLLYRIL